MILCTDPRVPHGQNPLKVVSSALAMAHADELLKQELDMAFQCQC